MFVYAEISKTDDRAAFFGMAPFLPKFAPGAANYCVDITGMEPAPAIGDKYDPETNTFSRPALPDDWDGCMGELILDTVQGGAFSDGMAEVNAFAGQRVAVQGRLTDREGETITAVSVPALRLPIIPTDINGSPLENGHPSMALASINQGIVTAFWEPEQTGTFAITMKGVNVRLPYGQRIKFKGLEVFVLPAEGAAL